MGANTQFTHVKTKINKPPQTAHADEYYVFKSSKIYNSSFLLHFLLNNIRIKNVVMLLMKKFKGMKRGTFFLHVLKIMTATGTVLQ